MQFIPLSLGRLSALFSGHLNVIVDGPIVTGIQRRIRHITKAILHLLNRMPLVVATYKSRVGMV